jgi:hypothetical protein
MHGSPNGLTQQGDTLMNIRKHLIALSALGLLGLAASTANAHQPRYGYGHGYYDGQRIERRHARAHRKARHYRKHARHFRRHHYRPHARYYRPGINLYIDGLSVSLLDDRARRGYRY